MAQLVVDQLGAGEQEQCPAGAGEHGARPQCALPPRDPYDDGEPAPEHQDVDHQGRDQADQGGEVAEPPEGTEPGQRPAGQEPHSQHREESGRPGQPVPEVGQLVAVDSPDHRHHHLGTATQPHAPVEQPDQAHGQGQGVVGGELVHVVPQVGAEDRELAQGGVDDVVLKPLVAVQEDAHHRQQHQQHREHGQKGRVGDLSRQPSRLVVRVLAQDRARHGGGPVALLEPVGSVDQPLDLSGRPLPGPDQWRHRPGGAISHRPGPHDRAAGTPP